MSTVYKCLNPAGFDTDIERYPLCQRQPLDGKKVYLLDIGRPNSDVLISIARKYIKQRLPESELVYYCKENGYRYDESEQWWDTLYNEAAAVILFVGDCRLRHDAHDDVAKPTGGPWRAYRFIGVRSFYPRCQCRCSDTWSADVRWVEIPYPITDISEEDLDRNIAPSMDALVAGLIKELTPEDLSTEIIKAGEQKKLVVEGNARVYPKVFF